MDYLVRDEDSPTGNRQFTETRAHDCLNCEVQWPGAILGVSFGEFTSPSRKGAARTWIEERAVYLADSHVWGTGQ